METSQVEKPKISVIVRAYNESKHLPELFASLSKQTYKNFEVILVDSESTDSTVQIAKQNHARVVTINKSRFNYSFASNVGVKAAEGAVACFLSGHSVPANSDYLENLANIFMDANVGGCYGDVIPLSDGSLTERAFDYLGILKGKFTHRDPVTIENHIHPGILSCSNAAIRMSVFRKHQFVEELGGGGEDVEMANYVLTKTPLVVEKSSKLLVRHSHGSGFLKFIREYQGWQKMYDQVEQYIDETSSENQ